MGRFIENENAVLVHTAQVPYRGDWPWGEFGERELEKLEPEDLAPELRDALSVLRAGKRRDNRWKEVTSGIAVSDILDTESGVMVWADRQWVPYDDLTPANRLVAAAVLATERPYHDDDYLDADEMTDDELRLSVMRAEAPEAMMDRAAAELNPAS